MSPFRPSRRQAIALGTLGAAALAVGGGVTVAALTSGGSARTEGAGKRWREPDVVASRDGVLDLDLTAREATVSVGDQRVLMLTYNGTAPGPTLRVRPGDLLRIRLHNELDDPTNLHTHGLLVPPDPTGDDPFRHVAPGETADYEVQLPDNHPEGVCWYHPHHHGMVADQVFAGLAGALLVDAEDADAAPPRVAVITETTLADRRVAVADANARGWGRAGELVLTNGILSPTLAARPGSRMRMLVVNACVTRYLDLDLTGLDARLRGRDTLRHAPRAVTRLVIPSGGRADVELRVPEQRREVVSRAYDRGRPTGGMMGSTPETSDAVLLTLVPDDSADALAVAAAETSAVRDLRDARIDRRRTVTFGMSMGMGAPMSFSLDGRTFDPSRIDQDVPLGTVEEWTLENTSGMTHPFHLHSRPMQIVRSGGAGEPSLDVRDVVDVPSSGRIVVRIAFDHSPGLTVYHCHTLDHEDLGMMGTIRVG